MSNQKSESAFRTISEVAEALELKQHVLRFWETKFDQIQPVKRAAGRRYYRPEDIALIAGIRHLLHDQGLTIKGVQKLIKDEGVDHIRRFAEASEASKAAENNAPDLTLDRRSRLEAARQNLMQAQALLNGDNY